MATLPQILTTNTRIPAAIENKFKLPKLSEGMAKFAGMLPAGPNYPEWLTKVLEPPAPTDAGQPLSSFFQVTTPAQTSARLDSNTYFPAPNPAAGNVTQQIVTHRGF
jgi:hypothetical protein